MRILFLQFRENNNVLKIEQDNFLRYIKTDVDFLNTFNDKELNIDLNKYSGLILGGSGDFDLSDKDTKRDFYNKTKKSFPILGEVIEKDFPTLGVCFGHQLLADYLGEKVLSDENQKEVGSYNISLTEEGKKDNLFKDLPDSFVVQEGHKDSIERLPEGSLLLAKSDRCNIQSFRIKNNIYGVQFHPELTAEDIKIRLNHSPTYFQKDIAIEKSPKTPKIIYNFIKQL